MKFFLAEKSFVSSTESLENCDYVHPKQTQCECVEIVLPQHANHHATTFGGQVSLQYLYLLHIIFRNCKQYIQCLLISNNCQIRNLELALKEYLFNLQLMAWMEATATISARYVRDISNHFFIYTTVCMIYLGLIQAKITNLFKKTLMPLYLL